MIDRWFLRFDNNARHSRSRASARIFGIGCICCALVSCWRAWTTVFNRIHRHIGSKILIVQLKDKIKFSIFKAGGALASYIFGLLLHHIGRWDIVFYFVAATLVLWWILFVCIHLFFFCILTIHFHKVDGNTYSINYYHHKGTHLLRTTSKSSIYKWFGEVILAAKNRGLRKRAQCTTINPVEINFRKCTSFSTFIFNRKASHNFVRTVQS